jgi:hypothetical protein
MGRDQLRYMRHVVCLCCCFALISELMNGGLRGLFADEAAVEALYHHPFPRSHYSTVNNISDAITLEDSRWHWLVQVAGQAR